MPDLATTEEQRNSEWLKTLSSCCGIGLWDALIYDGDPTHPMTKWTWSGEFRRLLGYRTAADFPDTLLSWRQRIHPDDLAKTLCAFDATCSSGVGFDVNYRLRVRDGSYRWFRATGGVILDHDGRPRRACGSLTDIHNIVEADTMRRAHDAATRETELVRRSEQRLRVLIQNSSDVVLIIGLDGGIVYQSPTAETVWGYSTAALSRKSLINLVHPDDRGAVAKLWEQLQHLAGSTSSMELRLQLSGGVWRHTELVMTNLTHEPSIGGIVVTAHDIEQRKTYEQQLTRQAFYDALTGLPNRALCCERLDQALARSSRSHSRIGLLIVGLDGFKRVNDGLGHFLGNQLLVAAAARLVACCKSDDTVSRLGGDGFAIILDSLPEAGFASRFADLVIRAFEQPFTLDGRSLIVTASIGIAIGDATQCSADMMMRNVDVAMHLAKNTGRNRAVLFEASMYNDSLGRLELEADLRRAIEQDELCVHYQPIVALGPGRLLEFEALVRWNHPTRGLLSPGDFISLAEETGLIIPLGQLVLEQACRQAVRWQADYAPDPPLMLSVNLSPRQFQQASLDIQIAETLQKTGMDPTCLKLEITEGVIMSDVERTIPMLQKLKAIGVKLAIDDFGTGYSSLAYLKRLPLDVLKIDRSFVIGIEQNKDDLAIVQAIISLAKSLRLSITAEGIETIGQEEILTALCCDRGQGYLFSRPVDADAATQLIERDRPPVPVPAPFPRPKVSPGAGLRTPRSVDEARPVVAA